MSLPDKDGTFASTGAQGGTEMMLAGLRKHVPADLLDQFNIICSRVRHIDPKKKNILWLHDLWNDPEASHLRDARSLGRFAKLVFVSHFQQHSYYMGLSIPYSAGTVLQNAIEPIPEHTKPDAGPGRLNLIYHTTPHRGLELLVPVFTELAKTFPHIHLDVYSSFKAYGWPERDVKYEGLFELIKEHPQMTYHGYQPNHVVREALMNAHIFAYPSIWVETSCIAAIEAMSAGCDVICPTLGALPETTANFGFVYPYHEDPIRHAETCYSVLHQAISEYNHPGLKAKRLIQKRYTDAVYNWKNRATQWEQLLRGLLR